MSQQDFRLGDAVQISIGNVTTLQQSVEFYQALGFKLLGQDVKPYPWAQLNDGNLNVVLNQDSMTYLGLTYFSQDAEQRGEEIAQRGIQFSPIEFNIGDFYQKIFFDPNQFGISIIGHDAAKIPTTDLRAKVFLGRFGELAVPTKDLDGSIEFWKKIGFRVAGKYEKPYPWAILKDDRIIIGLHQTQEFNQPAITYFAKDMGDKIQALQQQGVTIKDFTGTGGDESNKVAVAPEGTQIFLFSGDEDELLK